MSKPFLRNLQIGFGFSLVLLLASSTASYISIKEQINNRTKVDHSRRVIASANKILNDLQNAETGQRGFHLTGKEAFLEPYINSQKSLPQALILTKELVTDNPEQSQVADSLSSLVTSRLGILANLITIKRQGGEVSLSQLEEGKQYMDSCRAIIARFIDVEEVLLNKRSDELNKSSFYTSIFVVIAAIVSLLITIVFYLRIREDFIKREELQKSLTNKDEEISRRLKVTQRIANQIASGDYTVNVNDTEQDDLGSLGGSLNQMADALKRSFDDLNNNEWRQTGLAQLNETLVGNKTEQILIADALNQLISYGNCTNGAFYLWDQDRIVLKNAYGLEDRMVKSLSPGEGMIGQVFKEGKVKRFENLSNSDYVVSFASGQFRIDNVLLLPVFADYHCIGVIELGSINAVENVKLPYFIEATRNIGIAIAAAKSRDQVQQLLEETQTQTEELQAQHAELENLNTELEAQTQKLQSSEEELRVQQEELVQSNHELEERSKSLEEKNHLIAERNLEIQRKAEELALSTKYKSEFLANMSHELRTPLNSILLLSRLMSEDTDGNLNEDQIESAKVIQSSGTSLLSLIDEILDLSKIESGKMELDYQDVKLQDITHDLQNLFLPLIKEKSLSFDVSIDSNISDTIETDRLRLDQVLRNLLSNAVKFTSEGKISLSISEDKDHPENLIFEVRDTGIGIAEDKQKIIFEAFQQADGSTRRKFGGTGLGLSISREIARLLGGKILLTSKEGEGSVFKLFIPKSKTSDVIKPSSERLIDIIASDIDEMKSIVGEAVSPNIVYTIPEEVEDDRDHIVKGDKVILIVEDDTAFAKALLKYTRKQNYKGVVVVRGDIAAEFAARYLPLAILLDIQLPIKDGWQVMDEIKSNPLTRHIPVHIMSSLQVKKESLLKGAIDFINKPVAVEQIGIMFKKIEDALTRYPRKVLIVEENPKHASALSYFLSNFNITAEIKTNVDESVQALSSDGANCVILDMGVPDKIGYETLEAIKNNKGLENLPIIIFTGKNLSHAEEVKIKQYADSIVIKTAHSYQRILDEVGLFLHLVEENSADVQKRKVNKLGSLSEVLTGKKVLIADDDVRNIFSLSKALEKYQMNVISATNGKEALVQLENNPDVSIVLMDMMMPEMDGYETIRLMRKNPKYSKLPIMAVTAKAMTGDREKCIVAGASDYISKPVDTDQLLSLLRVWLYDN
ncbi:MULTISPECIES: response regulator [unclassified Sphingobacterium]|uniref:response regulator n=1 Tax=unclassified Sphingobacterium TaxID=2609468 RepID=UPI00143B4C0D|nr:response regulator [Sphingobacterium sp. B16(2022)]NJI73482.1 response regulator [Sphingobacterium sp. B16(2022)]